MDGNHTNTTILVTGAGGGQQGSTGLSEAHREVPVAVVALPNERVGRQGVVSIMRPFSVVPPGAARGALNSGFNNGAPAPKSLACVHGSLLALGS